ncbi:MAG: DNA replication/repair protein RecF [Alphaproteobacteria bacterium]|nr:DNA replication/repair protein RecF [Alphaproteobacteria bacterium]
MPWVSTLRLHNFRCYAHAALDGLGSGPLVLFGANGAGKTNILEALSLLSPGRGLRGVRGAEMQNAAASTPWAVSAGIETPYGPVQIGTGLDVTADKRLIRIGGENVRGQNALLEHVACVWLSPQMDRLFLDSSSHRRRFLDRLLFAFDPGHSGRVTRYENAMRQRSKLLQDGPADQTWLGALEAQMAETGVAISAARLEFVQRLQAACEHAAQEQGEAGFPLAYLEASGTIETLLGRAPALEVEGLFRYQLEESRRRDAVSGGAATGPHKSDLFVKYAIKDMAAAHCSTGEQKALLIGIVLAHARLMALERGAPPVLLLDEVAAHLDEGRRAALYELLIALGGQVWLTGTDRNLFTALEGRAQFFEICAAQICQVEAEGAPPLVETRTGG